MDEREVLERIEARRQRASRRLLDERITLAHGAGGRSSQALLEALLLPALRNSLLEPLADAAILELEDATRLAFSTDSYVVKPLRFPGGDIASSPSTGRSTTSPCPAPSRSRSRPR